MKRIIIAIIVTLIVIVSCYYLFFFNKGVSITIQNNSNQDISEISFFYKDSYRFNVPVIKSGDKYKVNILLEDITVKEVILNYQDAEGHKLFTYICCLNPSSSGNWKMDITFIEKEGEKGNYISIESSINPSLF